MSDVIPVVVQHPVLLDVASKEAMEGTGEPMSPLSFRGFRLHTIWTQQPGGELARHIPFPHFLGEGSLSLLKYESEKFPQGLRQGQNIVLSLKPPSKDHWNIASDLVLPLTLNASRQRRKAKRVAQGLEGRSEGVKVSPTEASTPGESSQLKVGGSGKALPIKSTHHREQVLETTPEILACIHTLHLQTMHKMGSVQELDRIVAGTLMAEFARQQLIMGENFIKSLLALHSDLEASCKVLMSNSVTTIDLHPNNPLAHHVKTALQTFQQSTSMKHLMQLEAAHGDMEEFMWSHL